MYWTSLSFFSKMSAISLKIRGLLRYILSGFSSVAGNWGNNFPRKLLQKIYLCSHKPWQFENNLCIANKSINISGANNKNKDKTFWL